MQQETQQMVNMAFLILTKGFELTAISSEATSSWLRNYDAAIANANLSKELGTDLCIIENEEGITNTDFQSLTLNLKKKEIPYSTLYVNGKQSVIINNKDFNEVERYVNSIRSSNIEKQDNSGTLAKALSSYNLYCGNPNYDASVYVEKNSLQNLSDLFDINGIPYQTIAIDEKHYLNFMSEDLEKAKYACNLLKGEKLPGGIISKDILIAESKENSYHDSPNLLKIQNLNANEMYLFVKNAEKNNVHVSITENKNDSYTLYFCGKDNHFIEHFKSSVAVSLTGIAGKAIETQLSYQAQNRETIEDMALYSDAKPFYIVDGTKNYLFVSDLSITNEQINILKNDTSLPKKEAERHLQKNFSKEFSRFDHPVYLSEEQYETYVKLDDKEKLSYIHDIDKQHGRPSLSQEEYISIYQTEKNRQLYEQKLSVGGAIQEYISYSYYDDDMQMLDFMDCEKLNRNLVHDKEEAFQKDAEFIDDARSLYRGYKEENNMDELDERTEKFANAILEERLNDRDVQKLQDELLQEYSGELDIYTSNFDNDYIDKMFADSSYKGNPYINDQIEFGDN